MKIRINYTITVDDDYRRAINRFYGRPGLATREEVVRWIRSHGTSEDDNLMWDSRPAPEPDPEEHAEYLTMADRTYAETKKIDP